MQAPTDKADAILHLGDLMDKGPTYLTKPEYLKAVFAREESGSTGLGMVLPHHMRNQQA